MDDVGRRKILDGWRQGGLAFLKGVGADPGAQEKISDAQTICLGWAIYPPPEGHSRAEDLGLLLNYLEREGVPALRAILALTYAILLLDNCGAIPGRTPRGDGRGGERRVTH